MGDKRTPEGWAKKRERDRAYGNAHADDRAARAKAWREKNKERQKRHQRRHHLKTTFGISLEDYDLMLAAQGGRCAICGTDNPHPWKALCVDHDHSTGRVRGLLCHSCNIGIGGLKDSPELMRKAARFVEDGGVFS